jgi:hypothetical protein
MIAESMERVGVVITSPEPVSANIQPNFSRSNGLSYYDSRTPQLRVKPKLLIARMGLQEAFLSAVYWK